MSFSFLACWINCLCCLSKVSLHLNASLRPGGGNETYAVSEWEQYARLHAAVTTSVQLELYQEACTHLYGDVVDLGCGTAKIAPLLTDNKRIASYTGIDYAEEMVAVARYVVQAQHRSSFTVQHNRIEDVKARFSSGVSIQSYYSWPNPVETLEHISRILTGKATFVLATPNKQLSIENLIKEAEKELIAHPDFESYKQYNLQLANNPQANFISMDKLIKQVQKVGFQVLECHQKHFQGGINFLVLYRE